MAGRYLFALASHHSGTQGLPELEKLGEYNLRHLLVFVAMALGTISLAAPVQAQAIDRTATGADRDAIVKVADTFIGAFNSGDLSVLDTVMTRDLVIMDEIPPYVWTGADATDTWLADLFASEAAVGRTGGKVWIGKPLTLQQTDANAYMVADTTYSFDEKGKPTVEKATMTLAFLKTPGGWKIRGWSWNLTAIGPAGK